VQARLIQLRFEARTMKAGKGIFSGIAGTALMTLFSYLVSDARQKNFREPVLLGGFVEPLLPADKKALRLPAGFMAHFSVGIAWALVFEWMFQHGKLKPGVKTAFALGGVSGVTGVLIWKAAFNMSDHPPRTDYKAFYSHLLIAHLVFCLPLVALASKPPLLFKRR
jgi:hypothetical protein